MNVLNDTSIVVQVKHFITLNVSHLYIYIIYICLYIDNLYSLIELYACTNISIYIYIYVHIYIYFGEIVCLSRNSEMNEAFQGSSSEACCIEARFGSMPSSDKEITENSVTEREASVINTIAKVQEIKINLYMNITSI